MTYTVSLDVSLEAPFPTQAHCLKHNILRLNILVCGPGGGNPEYTLTFPTKQAAENWLREIYFENSQVSDEELAVYHVPAG